jgi:nucleotide-binding universal stress UspA family protein
MYKQILVPLDGSKLAESVLPYVRCLAQALKAPVQLLHVNDPETVAGIAHPNRGEDYLRSVQSSVLKSLSVSSSVESGKAAEVIIDTAARDQSTLIAMATHGRSGIQRWLLGSVGHKVLHATANPLLLVRPQEQPSSDSVQLKTLVVPLDGSHLAEKVLPHALALARALKSELILTRVCSIPIGVQVVPEAAYVPNLNQLGESIREEAKLYLEAKVEQLRAEGMDGVSYVLMEGDSAAEIIDLARKTRDNLLAMCTHGRTGLNRWAIGSVTERVVRHCGDPVLVVRAL